MALIDSIEYILDHEAPILEAAVLSSNTGTDPAGLEEPFEFGPRVTIENERGFLETVAGAGSTLYLAVSGGDA